MNAAPDGDFMEECQRRKRLAEIAAHSRANETRLFSRESSRIATGIAPAFIETARSQPGCRPELGWEKPVGERSQLFMAWRSSARVFIVDPRGEARCVLIPAFSRYITVFPNKNPRQAKAWFERGVAMFDAGRYDDALICFREARRRGNSRADAAIDSCRRHIKEQQ